MQESNDTVFQGFEPPVSNYSRMPHTLIKHLPKINSLAELKVILYVLRHTWGFSEFEHPKRITMDEFEHGRKKKGGSRMDGGVGMSVNAIKEGLRRAVADGFMCQLPDGKDEGRSSYVYQLRMTTGGQELTGSEVDPLSESDPQGSEVDPQPSEVDPRSEKETLERNYREKGEDGLLQSLWSTILSNLKLQMTQSTYDSWLRGTQCIGETDHTLQVEAKSEQAVDWLTERLGGMIDRTALRLSDGRYDAVEFVAKEEQADACG